MVTFRNKTMEVTLLQNTQTLDERIRSRAASELHDEIRDSLNSFRARFIWTGVKISVKVKPDASAGELLDAIAAAVFDHNKEKRGEEAVNAFILKVDALQSQIDDLRELVPPTEL